MGHAFVCFRYCLVAGAILLGVSSSPRIHESLRDRSLLFSAIANGPRYAECETVETVALVEATNSRPLAVAGCRRVTVVHRIEIHSACYYCCDRSRSCRRSEIARAMPLVGALLEEAAPIRLAICALWRCGDAGGVCVCAFFCVRARLNVIVSRRIEKN